jgi:nicotinamide mononucleotide transporter
MSSLEILATVFGLINIILIVRRSVWNYPFAIGMVSLYARIFWDAKLYSDAGLQVFFVVVNVYGWWAWSRSKAEAGEIEVTQLTPSGRILWGAGAIVAAALWGLFMSRHTDASSPYWDAAVAMFSVAAQILMTRRYIENWHGWIIVNLLSIGLYGVKGLMLTMGLYVLFLLLAIWGLIEWRRVVARA